MTCGRLQDCIKYVVASQKAERGNRAVSLSVSETVKWEL